MSSKFNFPVCTKHGRIISVCSKLAHIHHFLEAELCDSPTFRAGFIDLTRQEIVSLALGSNGSLN